MSSDKGNDIGWTVPNIPSGERVAPSLYRPQQQPMEATKASVMDTLLGKNELAALDDSGSDPYNATGRQFRR
jgi:hypothetical protein